MMPKLQSVLDKFIFGPYMKRTLSKRIDKDKAASALTCAWKNYEEKLSALPPAKTWGGSLIARFAVISVELYKSLLREGLSEKDAQEELHLLAWNLYKVMGDFAWCIGKRKNNLSRVSQATKILRKTVFPAPDFGWDEIEKKDGLPGFNCTKCPTAAHFAKENLSDVCLKSICSLDDKLSKYWGVVLVRTNTIAGGAEVCDFRWRE